MKRKTSTLTWAFFLIVVGIMVATPTIGETTAFSDNIETLGQVGPVVQQFSELPGNGTPNLNEADGYKAPPERPLKRGKKSDYGRVKHPPNL